MSISEYKGKTFGEVIGQIEQKWVKIGTMQGSGFFFCGTSDEAKARKDQIAELLEKKRDKSVERAEAFVRNGINKTGISPEGYMRSLLKASKNDYTKITPTLEGYQEYLRDSFEALSRRARSLQKAIEKSEEFVPLNDRIIEDARMADSQFDPKDTLILMLEGWEAGETWDIFEAIERQKGKKGDEEDA